MISNLFQFVLDNWLDIYVYLCTAFVTVKIVFHQIEQVILWLETKSLW